MAKTLFGEFFFFKLPKIGKTFVKVLETVKLNKTLMLRI
jgi:hypothetical protein